MPDRSISGLPMKRILAQLRRGHHAAELAGWQDFYAKLRAAQGTPP